MVGSKAHNLMRMARRGLPVPPGFVLGTGVCRAYLEHGPAALKDLDEVLERELDALGARTGRRFGDPKRPAPRVGALRRRSLDAGHDGDGAQHRTDASNAAGPASPDRQPAT